MSTDTGDRAVVDAFVQQAKAEIAESEREAQQLDMLDPPSPEDLLEAREDLGPEASGRLVAMEARRRKRGRPAGARNRRTDDFKRYILGFGQHPAITMMQIQSTPPEVLVEASKRKKVHSFQKDGTANVVVEAMTYETAQSLRARCAEGLLPYLESKMPTAVDMTFNGVADLVIEGVTHSSDEMRDLIEGDWSPADDAEEAA